MEAGKRMGRSMQYLGERRTRVEEERYHVMFFSLAIQVR